MSQRVVLADGQKTATGVGEAVSLWSYPAVLTAELLINSAAAAAGDTLNVYVETKIGDDWIEVVHFSQVLGTAADDSGAINKIVGDEDASEFDLSAALAAGDKRHILGSEYRGRWVIGGGTPDFNFTLAITTEAR